MKIYLIRHGETTGDINERFGGAYDDNLTKKGKEQSQELAKQLQNKGIEIIFASPKIRAKETANEVNKIINVPVEIIEDLKERNTYGVLTGLTKKEAQDKHPIDFEKILKDKIHHNVTNSESYENNTKRIIKTFDKIFSKKYNTIAVVSHGGIISNYIREVLTDGKNIELGDCAVLEINKNKNKITFNCLINSKLIN